METMTEKQEAVLRFIEAYQMKNGSSPTLREMREQFHVSSDNSILKHLNALIEKGYIEKDDTPRGIKLLPTVQDRLSTPSIKLPLLGSIPAGGPVLSEEYVIDWMHVGEDVVKKPKNSFLLRVYGDSMQDAGILEDDLVIACSDIEPKSGDIVVALVDEANTIKRFMKEKNGSFYLKPENAKYENIYPETDLQIQGVVTGLIRAYR